MDKYIQKLFFVIGIAVFVLIFYSCKSLSPETLRPKTKNEKLLPPLTSVFDYESFYSVFPITISSGTVDTGAYGTGAFTAATYKNPILEDFKIIFQRDVNGNICVFDLDETRNGTIKCSLIEANGKQKYWWLIPSSLTFFIPNLLGMPLGSVEQELQIEVSIYDRNNNRIGRYTSDLHKDKSFSAMYYGYKSPSSKTNRLIFTKCMEDIKRQIEKDYNRLNEALK